MESVECLVVGAGVIGLCRAGAGRPGSHRHRKRERDWRRSEFAQQRSHPCGDLLSTGVDKTLLCVKARQCNAMLYAFCQEFRVPRKRIAFGASGVQGHFRRGERRFRRTYQLPNRRCSTRADTRGARVDRRRQRGPFDPHWTTIRPVSKRASTSRTTAWRMLLISKSFGV
jgi:hypothetical protein